MQPAADRHPPVSLMSLPSLFLSGNHTCTPTPAPIIFSNCNAAQSLHILSNSSLIIFCTKLQQFVVTLYDTTLQRRSTSRGHLQTGRYHFKCTHTDVFVKVLTWCPWVQDVVNLTGAPHFFHGLFLYGKKTHHLGNRCSSEVMSQCGALCSFPPKKVGRVAEEGVYVSAHRVNYKMRKKTNVGGWASVCQSLCECVCVCVYAWKRGAYMSSQVFVVLI